MTNTNFDVNPGDVIECTFINQGQGTIKIIKDSGDFSGTFNYVLDSPNNADDSTPQITTDGFGDGTSGPTTVDAGLAFSLTEDDPSPAFAAVSVSCVETGSNASLTNTNFDVNPGDVIECTFVNVKNGTLKIVKITEGGNDQFEFAISGGPTPISNQILITVGGIDTSAAIVVKPGAYTVEELLPPAGFVLDSISCDDGGSAIESTFDVGTRTAIYNIEPGEDVICTYTNTFIITAIDVSITKTVNDPTPNVSDTITWTVRVKNNGPSDATNVLVTDTIPAGVTFVLSSITTNTGSKAFDNVNKIVWTIPTIIPGQSFQLNFDTTVDTGTAGSMIFNTVVITSLDQTDSDPTNNFAFAKITVDAIRTLKGEIVGELEAEVLLASDTILIKRLESAIKNINESRDPAFYESDPILDRAHGNRVFHEEETAVRTLQQLLDKADECVSVESFTVEYDNTLPVMIEVKDTANSIAITQDPLKTVILDPGDDIIATPTVATSLPNSLTYLIKDTGGNVIETIIIGPDLCLIDAHEVFTEQPTAGQFDLEVMDFEKTFSFSSGLIRSTTLEVVQRAIDGMETVDRGVALTIIEFAENPLNFPTPSSKFLSELVTAKQQLAEGDIDRALDKTAKAIHHYEQAWHHATLALADAGFFLEPDLSLDITVDNATPTGDGSDFVTYTITIENKGPVDFTTVVIEDNLPSGVMFSTFFTLTGAYDAGFDLWTIPGGLLQGQIATLDITVSVDSGVVGTLIMNTASHDSGTVPVDPFPPSDTVTILLI